jgi:hypothetical protein
MADGATLSQAFDVHGRSGHVKLTRALCRRGWLKNGRLSDEARALLARIEGKE